MTFGSLPDSPEGPKDAAEPRRGQDGGGGRLRYLSVCSGIEAATVAWQPLGWAAAAFSEIEPFPAAVLAHHYPETPNLGDMTGFKEWPDDAGIDLLVGGTPCQSFSVAGLRQGLDDPRGNLALVYLALADRYRPRWLVWENVPGVLSSGEGRDFGAILGALGQLGYGWAYRVLDAQFFGVPQRRRRVFLVGYSGDWRAAAAVLFEPEGLRGDSPPRREAGAGVAALTANGVGTCGADDNQGQAGHLVAHSLRGEGFDASEDGTGRGTPIVPCAFHNRQDPVVSGDLSQPLGAKDNGHGVMYGAAVRRLTPRECERLQGFPDDYTLIPMTRALRKAVDAEMADYYRRTNQDLTDDALRRLASDGPRYKALGNSMAVPVMAWIGGRIALCDAPWRAAAA